MGGQSHSPATLHPGKDQVPVVYEAAWTPGTVWEGAENFTPTRIRSPDCLLRSESLYRLSYSGPEMRVATWNVRILYRAGAMNELVEEMDKYKTEEDKKTAGGIMDINKFKIKN